MNPVTAETLNRTAKYFMDTGRAESAEAATDILQGFGLSVLVGPEIASSRDHQVALLTLINCARRTLLGGVHLIGVSNEPNLTGVSHDETLRSAAQGLGAILADTCNPHWPSAIIGTAPAPEGPKPVWQLTWSGWRGGVIPHKGKRLDEKASGGLSATIAAAACASEAFLFLAGDHPMAGRRSSGLSLWDPKRDWLEADEREPAILYLPSRLWVIGLGNLGQAYLWILACLNYARSSEVTIFLQDFDRIAPSNDSTSLLSNPSLIGQMKTRAMSAWLESRGFETRIEERAFGAHQRRSSTEPAVGLCGVDNALARRFLECAGFDWVIESGLGAGPAAFKNFALHTFPSDHSAEKLWSEVSQSIAGSVEPWKELAAYKVSNHPDLDECGLTQLASRSIGVPFVGLTAACLVIAEILRRLHGGRSFAAISGSMATLGDIEVVEGESLLYPYGHTEARE
jgi:hypothetical protein